VGLRTRGRNNSDEEKEFPEGGGRGGTWPAAKWVLEKNYSGQRSPGRQGMEDLGLWEEGEKIAGFTGENKLGKAKRSELKGEGSFAVNKPGSS